VCGCGGVDGAPEHCCWVCELGGSSEAGGGVFGGGLGVGGLDGFGGVD